MKLIKAKIDIQDIYNRCSHWTLNRVLTPKDPNGSHELNDAYAMTEDDKDEFFYPYLRKGVSHAVLNIFSPFWSELLVNYKAANEYDIVEYSRDNSFVSIYMIMHDSAPPREVINVFCNWLQYYILYYWYWLKGYDQQFATQERDVLERELNAIASRFGGTGRPIQRYVNNFFEVLPRTRRRTVEEFDPTIVYSTDPVLATQIILLTSNDIWMGVGNIESIAYRLYPSNSFGTVNLIDTSSNHVVAIDNVNKTIRGLREGTTALTLVLAENESIRTSINVRVEYRDNLLILSQPTVVFSNPNVGVQTAIVTIEATTIDGTLIEYQWFKDGQAVLGNPSAQTNQLVLNPLAGQEGTYYCVLRNGDAVKTSRSVAVEPQIIRVFAVEYQEPPFA